MISSLPNYLLQNQQDKKAQDAKEKFLNQLKRASNQKIDNLENALVKAGIFEKSLTSTQLKKERLCKLYETQMEELTHFTDCAAHDSFGDRENGSPIPSKMRTYANAGIYNPLRTLKHDLSFANFMNRHRAFNKINHDLVMYYINEPQTQENLQNNSLRLSNLGLTRFPQSLLKALPIDWKKITHFSLGISHRDDLNRDHLGDNKISELPEGLLQMLSHVTRLELIDLGLTILPASIGSCSQLAELDISINDIESIPEEIGQCTRLTSLNAQRNKLCVLPNALANCKEIVSLNLQHNKLLLLPDFLNTYPRLQKLFLAYNNLHYISPLLGNALHDMSSTYDNRGWDIYTSDIKQQDESAVLRTQSNFRIINEIKSAELDKNMTFMLVALLLVALSPIIFMVGTTFLKIAFSIPTLGLIGHSIYRLTNNMLNDYFGLRNNILGTSAAFSLSQNEQEAFSAGVKAENSWGDWLDASLHPSKCLNTLWNNTRYTMGRYAARCDDKMLIENMTKKTAPKI